MPRTALCRRDLGAGPRAFANPHFWNCRAGADQLVRQTPSEYKTASGSVNRGLRTPAAHFHRPPRPTGCLQLPGYSRSRLPDWSEAGRAFELVTSRSAKPPGASRLPRRSRTHRPSDKLRVPGAPSAGSARDRPVDVQTRLPTAADRNAGFAEPLRERAPLRP